jgi:hypothetical protein
MADELEALGAAFETRGYWTLAEVERVVLLIGASPVPEELHRDADAYCLVLGNLCCRPEPPEAEIAALLEPRLRPRRFLRCDEAQLRQTPERYRVLLLDVIRDMLTTLRREEAELEAGIESLERARVLEPALILQDPDQARLYHRYQGEYRASFHRAHQALMAVLKRDAAADVECEVEAPEGDEAGPRNEPSSESKVIEESVVAVPTLGDETRPPGRLDAGCVGLPKAQEAGVLASYEGGAEARMTPPVPAAPGRRADVRATRASPEAPTEGRVSAAGGPDAGRVRVAQRQEDDVRAVSQELAVVRTSPPGPAALGRRVDAPATPGTGDGLLGSIDVGTAQGGDGDDGPCQGPDPVSVPDVGEAGVEETGSRNEPSMLAEVPAENVLTPKPQPDGSRMCRGVAERGAERSHDSIGHPGYDNRVGCKNGGRVHEPDRHRLHGGVERPEAGCRGPGGAEEVTSDGEPAPRCLVFQGDPVPLLVQGALS